ncbi:MAG: DegT/DnrJ/EryC1/StrS family aminotransferase [Saprospiraceae bacterium]|nr:DegT/DnrJ/EryC1/StrS family aminotransferase [Saprospiraceae bacterium]
MSKLISRDMLPMVDLKGQYANLQNEILSGFQEVLEKTQFINGPAVKDFASHLSEYLSVKYTIPCGNGTDALQIALMSLGLRPGDEVITTPFTFVATAEVIGLLGLVPVFVDVDPETFLLDVTKLESKITSKTKCVIPVHLFGQCVDMESLLAICNKHDLRIVEDNAQAIGAEIKFSDGSVRKAGTIGDLGTTSFFPSKNLGCYGDGGAIFTNSDVYGDLVRMVVNHGSSKKYYHDVIGVNSRLDTLQAIVLNAKLPHLDKYNKARQAVAAFYNEKFKGLDSIQTPRFTDWSSHVFHQYTLKLNGVDRSSFMDYLKAAGISTAVYYPVPLHVQKGYQGSGYTEGDFPVSEELSRTVISLPIHTEMDADKLEYITSKVIEYFN